MLKSHRLAALAAVLVVASITPANAITVSYSTEGVFGVNGTNSFLTKGGVTVTYVAASESYTINDALNNTTVADFGHFEVTGTAGALAQYDSQVDTFTLTITQSAPTPTGAGTATFESTLNGTIVFETDSGGSSAYVQFDPSGLSRTIKGLTADVTYLIVESDRDPGRVDLDTGDQSNINGRITIAHAPEPGTMAMACLALPLLGLGYMRHRRRQAAS
jgi:hypothetical protein